MAFAQAMQQAMRLIAQMEALAAFGAALDPDAAPPEIRERLDAVTGALDPEALVGLTADQAGIVRSMIRTFFRQSMDLLENPARPAQWAYDDPLILQNVGQISRVIVHMIDGMASEAPDLARRIARPGRFLDIGSGVGWLSIEAARTWPMWSVEGLDLFAPALALAEVNLAGSDVADRVRFRSQDIAGLDERDRYAAAFFAGPFIPAQVVPAALDALARAIEPGGWLFFGLFRAPPGDLPQALLRLRITRSGGYPWTVDEVRQLLDTHGFDPERTVDSDTPAFLVAARRR